MPLSLNGTLPVPRHLASALPTFGVELWKPVCCILKLSVPRADKAVFGWMPKLDVCHTFRERWEFLSFIETDSGVYLLYAGDLKYSQVGRFKDDGCSSCICNGSCRERSILNRWKKIYSHFHIMIENATNLAAVVSALGRHIEKTDWCWVGSMYFQKAKFALFLIQIVC